MRSHSNNESSENLLNTSGQSSSYFNEEKSRSNSLIEMSSSSPTLHEFFDNNFERRSMDDEVCRTRKQPDFGIRRMSHPRLDDQYRLESMKMSFVPRVSVLLLLFLLQSMSSQILAGFSELLKDNVILIFFLTAMIGAGGNAGNQAAVITITGLAMKRISMADMKKVLYKELGMALLIGLSISTLCAIRVSLSLWLDGGKNLAHRQALGNTVIAITLSIFLIVFISIIIGTLLPFALSKFGFDPVHAGPTIQVLMDCLGVLISCMVASAILPK